MKPQDLKFSDYWLNTIYTSIPEEVWDRAEKEVLQTNNYGYATILVEAVRILVEEYEDKYDL